MSEREVSHRVWEAFYHEEQDSPRIFEVEGFERLFENPKIAKEAVSKKAGVKNENWEKWRDSESIVFTRKNTRHYIITVASRPVYR